MSASATATSPVQLIGRTSMFAGTSISGQPDLAPLVLPVSPIKLARLPTTGGPRPSPVSPVKMSLSPSASSAFVPASTPGERKHARVMRPNVVIKRSNSAPPAQSRFSVEPRPTPRAALRARADATAAWMREAERKYELLPAPGVCSSADRLRHDLLLLEQSTAHLIEGNLTAAVLDALTRQMRAAWDLYDEGITMRGLSALADRLKISESTESKAAREAKTETAQRSLPKMTITLTASSDRREKDRRRVQSEKRKKAQLASRDTFESRPRISVVLRKGACEDCNCDESEPVLVE